MKYNLLRGRTLRQAQFHMGGTHADGRPGKGGKGKRGALGRKEIGNKKTHTSYVACYT